jgi:hypothetical protein
LHLLHSYKNEASKILDIQSKKTDTMNLQAQKEIIIEQFKEVNDASLIKAIGNLLEYARKKEKEVFEIPDAQQKLVMERFRKVRSNPERLLDWDEAKETLKS